MSRQLCLTPASGGTRLRLRVKAGARASAIVGPHGGALKVTVAAPPERGKANRAVVDLLAEALGLPSSSLEIVQGATSPDKVLWIPLSAAEIEARLGRER
jgi:uncharacterized protein